MYHAKVKGSGIDRPARPKDEARARNARRWQLRVSAGRDLSTGKYRTFLRSFAGTFTQAQQALRDFISEIESGEAKKGRRGATVEQYAASWIAFRRADDGISDGTVDKNEAHLKCVVMHLGKARLHELAPKVVERAYSKLMDGESPSWAQPVRILRPGRPFHAAQHARRRRFRRPALREPLRRSKASQTEHAGEEAASPRPHEGPLRSSRRRKRACRRRAAVRPDRLAKRRDVRPLVGRRRS